MSEQKYRNLYNIRLVFALCMLGILLLSVRLAVGQNSPSDRNPILGNDTNFAPAVHGEKAKRILILHSYQPKSIKDEITDTVISDLKSRFEDIDLYIEYMDTKRFKPEPAYLDGLAELYQAKYSNMRFDVILCSDNDALNFLVTRGEKLFSDTPVVFLGVDNFSKEMLQGKTNFTGVVGMLNMKKMVEVPLQILPKTQRIVVIHDETSTGQAIMNQFVRQSVPEEFPNLEFIYLSGEDFTYQEMFDRVRKLSYNSIILLMGFAQDRLGQHLSQEDHRPRLSKASPVPVFADSKYDCIGGLDSGTQKQGGCVARYVARILEGEPVDSVPILYEDMSELTFNYEQLKRFRIPFSRLPEGSVIINEPASFYYRHKKLIFSVSGFILTLIVIIMILTINIFRRIHAEQSLKKSSIIIDSTTDAVITTDVAGNITFWNKGAERIYSYKKDEVLGKPISIIYKDEDLHALESMVSDLMNAKDIPSIEVTCIDKNQKDVQILLSLTTLKDKDGNITELVGITKDITEHKRAEDALRESEERLNKAFQSNPNLMGILDLDENRRLIMNDSFTRITGYSIQDGIGSNFDELNFWIDQEKLNEALSLIKQNHVLQDYEIDIRTKQGQIRTLRYNGATLDIPDKNLAMFSAEDITEQKKAEQDMRQYEHLVASSTDMLALLDAQYVYLAANQAYAEAFQRSQVDLVGHT
ncbi:MAG: PAS domain S-box protein, partial [Planctomycetota bacterium]